MGSLLATLINIYVLVIFIRLIMSWFPPTPGTGYAQIYDAFVTVTEPVLAPVRSLLPPFRMGATGIDLSPMVVIFGLLLIARIVGGG
jgi:YggT family protein